MYEKIEKRPIRADNESTNQKNQNFLQRFFGQNKGDIIRYETEKKPGTRHRLYTILIPIKLLIFYVAMVIITWKTNLISNPSELTDFFVKSFNNHTYKVTSIQMEQVSGSSQFDDGIYLSQTFWLFDDIMHPLWVLLVQTISSYLTYFAVKFASKEEMKEGIFGN